MIDNKYKACKKFVHIAFGKKDLDVHLPRSALQSKIFSDTIYELEFYE